MAASYLKEWRKHRHLTQDQVVDRLAALDDPMLPATAASLSRVENGKQIYTQRLLEALADIYVCEPHELLGHNPFKEGQVIDLLARLSDSQARQVRVMIEALVADAG